MAFLLPLAAAAAAASAARRAAEAASIDTGEAERIASLEAELGDAMRELTLAHDELDAVMNTHMCIPGIDDSHAGNLLHDVHAALQDVEELASGHESGELITAYISDRAAKKVRDAAEAGAMQELKKAEAERSKWPKYMVMAGWDFTDHRGDSAVHLAARNGRHDALEFLLVRKALPSLVNARGMTALLAELMGNCVPSRGGADPEEGFTYTALRHRRQITCLLLFPAT